MREGNSERFCVQDLHYDMGDYMAGYEAAVRVIGKLITPGQEKVATETLNGIKAYIEAQKSNETTQGNPNDPNRIPHDAM